MRSNSDDHWQSQHAAALSDSCWCFCWCCCSWQMQSRAYNCCNIVHFMLACTALNMMVADPLSE